MARYWLVLFSCASVLGATLGCASQPKAKNGAADSDAGSSAIEEINLLAIPVALNLDQAPGLDGFMIKVYATSRKRPKAMPIESGKIDVFMFDGIPATASPVPLATWSYTAQDLERFQIQSSIGKGYQIAPAWGKTRPTQSKIAVVVRYTPPDGPAITSAPSIIAVALK